MVKCLFHLSLAPPFQSQPRWLTVRVHKTPLLIGRQVSGYVSSQPIRWGDQRVTAYRCLWWGCSMVWNDSAHAFLPCKEFYHYTVYTNVSSCKEVVDRETSSTDACSQEFISINVTIFEDILKSEIKTNSFLPLLRTRVLLGFSTGMESNKLAVCKLWRLTFSCLVFLCVLPATSKASWMWVLGWFIIENIITVHLYNVMVEEGNTMVKTYFYFVLLIVHINIVYCCSCDRANGVMTIQLERVTCLFGS